MNYRLIVRWCILIITSPLWILIGLCLQFVLPFGIVGFMMLIESTVQYVATGKAEHRKAINEAFGMMTFMLIETYRDARHFVTTGELSRKPPTDFDW